jgi:hypothetical protein
MTIAIMMKRLFGVLLPREYSYKGNYRISRVQIVFGSDIEDILTIIYT